MKNGLAPISRVPPELITLIPGFWEAYYREKDVIALTHVCRAWREIFTSRPFLWTQFNCANADKTRVYLKRSKSSPINLQVQTTGDPPPHDPFFQIIPHATGRLQSLSIDSITGNLQSIIDHLSHPAPLLKYLKIDGGCESEPERNTVLTTSLFNGDLSSLRVLQLSCVRTELPWRNMVNLVSFVLCHTLPGEVSIRQVLDFFESAPRLHNIQLRFAIPTSGGQDGRLVPLAYLKRMNIVGNVPSSLLLDHLLIPAGATLGTEIAFDGPLIENHLPRSLDNLRNLSNFTKISLRVDNSHPHMQFTGPNGEVSIAPVAPRVGLTSLALESLAGLDTSSAEQLDILRGDPLSRDLPYQVFLPMENLHSLTLSRCKNPRAFVCALDPNLGSSGVMVCPRLKEIALVLRTGRQEFDIGTMIEMAAARASKGAKLARIRILDRRGRPDLEGVQELGKHALQVEYGPRVNIPDDADDSGDEDSEDSEDYDGEDMIF